MAYSKTKKKKKEKERKRKCKELGAYVYRYLKTDILGKKPRRCERVVAIMKGLEMKSSMYYSRNKDAIFEKKSKYIS